MSSVRCTEKTQLGNNNNNHLVAREEEEEEQYFEEANQQRNDGVTSHVYLKPAHSSQSLEKEEVLRRIRQRKRVNKLRSTLHHLIRLPPPSKPASAPQKRWVDDPFAAL